MFKTIFSKLFIPHKSIHQPIVIDDEEWKLIENVKPPNDVLAACYTYDCGWSIDSVWWNVDDKCWMTTGGVKSHKTHLPYSHWRELPNPPKNINIW
jgi:hypothetical protein